MKKIAIYGAGSLGTVLGAYLRQAGLDVDLINHNIEHINALKKHGAIITGSVQMKVPVRALLPVEVTEDYDLILLVTKQLNNKEVVKDIQSLLKSDGILCTMQNGLPEPEISKILGENRVIGCTVGFGSTLLSPGVVKLTSDRNHLTFGLGTYDGIRRDKVVKLKHILEHMGPVEIVDNFVGIRWSKLIVDASFSGISTVLGCTYGEAVDHKIARRYILQLINEGIEVARAVGVKLAPLQGKDMVKLLYYRTPWKRLYSYHILSHAIKKHRLTKASMLQDIEHNKPCEVDAINGVVCNYGKKYKVPTPICDKVVEIIYGIEMGLYRPCFENLSLF